jgi:hypothetical protein
MFVVYVDVEYSVKNAISANPTFKFKYSIKDAKCVPLGHGFKILEPDVEGSDDTIKNDKIASPAPGMLVANVYDEFPGIQAFPLSFELPLDCRVIPYRHSWLE